MNIAILQCDDVLDKLKAKFGSYSGMIQQMLTLIDPDLNFEVFDCQKREYPDDLKRYDFFITTGSRESAYEDTPWIHQLIEFIRHLDQQQHKLVGICFGHQLIAKAMNCEVTKSERGWGVGVARNRMLEFPDWMGQHKDMLNLIVSHQDQVIQVTDQTRIIASSDFCPYFMLQWNDHILGVQGHPEFNVDYSRALMLERKNIIPAERIERGLQSLQIPPDNQMFTRWILDFVNNPIA